MPSPITHMTSGYLLFRFYRDKLPDNNRKVSFVPIQLLIFTGISLLPDLDSIPGILFGDFHRFHNNISHSLLAGFLAASIIASLLAWKQRSYWALWFVAVLLTYEVHIFLDLFTGERGLMLLWPFTQERFTSPIKLFYGVQWGLGLVSVWHVWTILTEIIFILVILMIAKLYKFVRSRIPL